MKMAIVFLFICTTLLAAEPQTKTPYISKAIRADIKLMWETAPLSGDHQKKASTGRAISAAQRVFTSIRFTGMTRKQIIQALGDPHTSSDRSYNFPFYPIQAGVLFYRFDTGFGGWQFDIHFDSEGHAKNVVHRGIE